MRLAVLVLVPLVLPTFSTPARSQAALPAPRDLVVVGRLYQKTASGTEPIARFGLVAGPSGSRVVTVGADRAAAGRVRREPAQPKGGATSRGAFSRRRRARFRRRPARASSSPGSSVTCPSRRRATSRSSRPSRWATRPRSPTTSSLPRSARCRRRPRPRRHEPWLEPRRRPDDGSVGMTEPTTEAPAPTGPNLRISFRVDQTARWPVPEVRVQSGVPVAGGQAIRWRECPCARSTVSSSPAAPARRPVGVADLPCRAAAGSTATGPRPTADRFRASPRPSARRRRRSFDDVAGPRADVAPPRHRLAE
jgi:hypothetical protein